MSEVWKQSVCTLSHGYSTVIGWPNKADIKTSYYWTIRHQHHASFRAQHRATLTKQKSFSLLCVSGRASQSDFSADSRATASSQATDTNCHNKVKSRSTSATFSGLTTASSTVIGSTINRGCLYKNNRLQLISVNVFLSLSLSILFSRFIS